MLSTSLAILSCNELEKSMRVEIPSNANQTYNNTLG